MRECSCFYSSCIGLYGVVLLCCSVFVCFLIFLLFSKALSDARIFGFIDGACSRRGIKLGVQGWVYSYPYHF